MDRDNIIFRKSCRRNGPMQINHENQPITSPALYNLKQVRLTPRQWRHSVSLLLRLLRAIWPGPTGLIQCLVSLYSNRSLLTSLHDPEIYPNPTGMQFNPDRFKGLDSETIQKKSTNSVFGFGRRLFAGVHWSDALCNHPYLWVDCLQKKNPFRFCSF